MTVPAMVAGDLSTMWRRIAVVSIVIETVTIVHPIEAAMHLCVLINPRLLPVRCRLFRRIRDPAARALTTRDPTIRDRADLVGFDASD